MKINQVQLYSALNEYIDREIMPLGASLDMMEQFMFYVKMGVAKRKLDGIVKNAFMRGKSTLFAVVDEEGNIDVDTLYQSASDALAQMRQIEIGGITFRDTDLQKLYGIIQKYATQ
jgi:hypothetical protein